MFRAVPAKYRAERRPSRAAPVTADTCSCPMHPEVARDGPGSCPICGMALEPRTPTLQEDDTEIKRMTRRFWIGLVLTLPLVWLSMTGRGTFAQLFLATPVVLYCGGPSFLLVWRSLPNLAL